MSLKLSHSQCAKYTQCPQAYKYHYIERIRPILSSAALLFGSALDNALNELLKPTKNISPEDVFISSFTNAELNGVSTYIPDCLLLTYAKADLDLDLIDVSEEEELKLISLQEKKSLHGLSALTEEEHLFFNRNNWAALRAKGLLMLKAYREQVVPLIEEVLDVQIPIELSNGDDTVVGYVDLVARIKGHGVVVLDNKTSSIEYSKDSVITSTQLSLYMHALQDKYLTRNAGYIVLNKRVRKNREKICSKCSHDGSAARHTTCPSIINSKRCGGTWVETINPTIDIQIIINEIPKRTEDIVLDMVDSVGQAIKNNVFPRNFHSCDNMYGGKCPYYNLCYKQSKTGLQEVEK